MIPAPFAYRRAHSVQEALELLREDPEAKLLAGGHSLVPLLKLRLAQPSLLVDVGGLDDLAYVREDGGQIAIGALTRHHAVASSPLLAADCPILARTAGQVGDPQVRHRGTIGGSCAHGDAASDLPTVLLALGATFVIEGAGGRRSVGADDFFTGFLETAVGPDELLVEIRVPRLAAGTRAHYLKFTRRAQDWATVGVAVVCDAAAGTVAGARVALTNMGATPVRAAAVEQRLTGAPVGPEAFAAAAAHAGEGTSPPSDVHGSADYRRHLATVLTGRALELAHANGNHDDGGISR